MEEILEEKASLYNPSGTTYVRASPTFLRFIGIEDRENLDKYDVKICMGRGKHGRFLYIYNAEQQENHKKQDLEQEKEKNQA